MRYETTTAFAGRLGIPPGAVRHYVHMGILPAAKLGRRVLVNVEEAEAKLEELRIGEKN